MKKSFLVIVALLMFIGTAGAPDTRGKSLDQITRERYGE